MVALAQKRIVAKPWGSVELGALRSSETQRYTTHGQAIGEVWFEPNRTDVLVKYLFTSKRLSIQVHPDDAQAREMRAVRGKDECWLILEAHPGAHYGIGLTRNVTAQELASAARNGSIVDLVDWRRARVGDFIFSPANTIHALGPGLTVLEVQQHSDVTLRLFDYDSDRALRVERAVAIAKRSPHHHPLDTTIDFAESCILVDGPKFGLAYCNERVPRLPANCREMQLVTWKDTIRVGPDFVPPGSMMRLDGIDDIRGAPNQRFFIVWSLGPPQSTALQT